MLTSPCIVVLYTYETEIKYLEVIFFLSPLTTHSFQSSLRTPICHLCNDTRLPKNIKVIKMSFWLKKVLNLVTLLYSFNFNLFWFCLVKHVVQFLLICWPSNIYHILNKLSHIPQISLHLKLFYCWFETS